MPSSWSTSLRLNYQAPGDNLNAWGVILNQQVFQRLEEALTKRVAFDLSGAKALATANGLEDEARCAFLDVTGGSGGVITAPAVDKLYIVRNGTVGEVELTTGAGQTALFKPGELGWAVCDSARFYRAQLTDMGGARLGRVGEPLLATDAATKGYVDGAAFSKVELPGQNPGTVGKFVRSDGASAGWSAIEVAEVEGAAPVHSPSFIGGMTVSGATKITPVAVSALDVDWAEGEMQTKALSSSGAITFSGFEAGKAQVLVLKLTISSSAVPTWPANVAWDNDTVPNLPNGVSVVGFLTFDGGQAIEGVVIGEAFN